MLAPDRLHERDPERTAWIVRWTAAGTVETVETRLRLAYDADGWSLRLIDVPSPTYRARHLGPDGSLYAEHQWVGLFDDRAAVDAWHADAGAQDASYVYRLRQSLTTLFALGRGRLRIKGGLPSAVQDRQPETGDYVRVWHVKLNGRFSAIGQPGWIRWYSNTELSIRDAHGNVHRYQHTRDNGTLRLVVQFLGPPKEASE